MKNRDRIKVSDLWGQIDFSSYSILSLIFSNVLIILFAIIDGLSALDVMWIYWFQSVIIGIFNFIKMLSLKEFSTEGLKKGNNPAPPTKSTKISTALFFLIHYGFFHLIYAVFLGSFSVFADGIPRGGSQTRYLLISAGMFFISYFIEFINSRKEEPVELPNLGKIMFEPYTRIIPMHLTIILGGFIAMAGSFFAADTNLLIIVLFIGLKSLIDLITHSVDFNKLMTRRA